MTRIAAFDDGGTRRFGVVSGAGEDSVVRPLPLATDVISLLDARPSATELAAACGPAVALAGLRLLPPVLPPTVRDFLTFEAHVEGVRRSIEGRPGVPDAWYAAPTFYFSNPHAVIGPHDDVAVPPGCTVLDFELEVAAVVGRAGSDLTVARARDHIVAYTIFNDWSARDLQRAEMQVGLGPAKGKDSANTLGPWLVSADELEPYRTADGFLDLALTASVNGAVVGRDRSSNMSWTFEEMVAYASRGTWVRPGDVLGSGTCGNGGCLAELWGRAGQQLPPPLVPGDEVTLEVEGIGSLRNRVVPGVEPVPIGPARRLGWRDAS